MKDCSLYQFAWPSKLPAAMRFVNDTKMSESDLCLQK